MMLKWIKHRYRNEGVAVPHWWLGYSHYEFDRDASIYYIIPVNIIVAVTRWLLLWIRYKLTHGLEARSKYEIEIVSRGIRAGLIAGRFVGSQLGELADKSESTASNIRWKAKQIIEGYKNKQE